MPSIAVIETNSAGNGIRAMEYARELGLRSVFACRDPGEYANRAVSPLDVADEVIVVDTFDAVKVLRALDGRDDCAAVYAYDELRVVQAALVAQHLGLGGPDTAAVLRARFKDRMRARLSGTEFHVEHRLIELDAQGSPLGYPCVVKPVDEAASVGVAVCETPADFAAAVRDLRRITACRNSRGYQRIAAALVEELLPGQEYSAEMVWSDRLDAWRLIGFTAKQVSNGRSRIELEHVFPHTFGSSADKRIAGSLSAGLQILGLRHTLVHAEFRVSGERVSLIEVNPRPAGDLLRELTRRAIGVDLVDLHVAAHLGTADNVLDQAEYRANAGIRFLIPDRCGTITGFRIDPGAEGDNAEVSTVNTPFTIQEISSNEARIGHVLAEGDSPQSVQALLTRAAGRVSPVYLAAAQ